MTDEAGCTAGPYNTKVHSMMVATENEEEAQKYNSNVRKSDGEKWVLVKNAEEKQKTIHVYDYRTLNECRDDLTRGGCSVKKQVNWKQFYWEQETKNGV